VVLFTHLVVREDAHVLFGFLRARDRDLFRRLIRVNGIGARLALAMLSTMAADELAGHITAGDVASLTRVPGIGKRTAERVVLELASA
jgi:holliday junction DNA helicase RuvA